MHPDDIRQEIREILRSNSPDTTARAKEIQRDHQVLFAEEMVVWLARWVGTCRLNEDRTVGSLSSEHQSLAQLLDAVVALKMADRQAAAQPASAEPAN